MNFPHEDVASLDAFYGNPRGVGGNANPQWEAENIVLIEPPYRMEYSGGGAMPHLRIHKKGAVPLMAALKGILEKFGSQEAIERARLHLTGGAYCYRLERGGSRLSVHSWGAAIDMDPGHNPFPKPWDHREGLNIEGVKVFEGEGFWWRGQGGDIDPMHLQLCKHT